MSKINPLVGLIGNYGDSDDESEDDVRGGTAGIKNHTSVVTSGQNYGNASAAIHPPPIPHCPWSACYDETSGFTYYWNQVTNAVTWDAPPEYLLALKLAQQQLTASGSGEVSAEEWQLYQQALAEKQTAQAKATVKQVTKANKKSDRNSLGSKNNKLNKKRSRSEDDEEKIELITSYHNSDSESNDETESPAKPALPSTPKPQPKPNNVYKKPKLKTQEYGPALPPSLNYSLPIGPELPPELSRPETKSPEVKPPVAEKEENSSKPAEEDSQDETTLLMKLKDKAKILEKLGGEIPQELQKMISEESGSGCVTPKTDDSSKSNSNIDDLLEEIEKKELPKISKTSKTDIIEDTKSNDVISAQNSPIRHSTPPIEHKPLFPSVANIENTPPQIENDDKKLEAIEKKGANLYLSDTTEHIDNVGKKKLRISNSVLPKKEPVYTTKYSQFIEGFSNERVGLGFSKEEDGENSPKNSIAYGNGLMFTKGETLNEEKKDEDLDDLTDLLEMKLKYLNQLQPCVLTPVQEMLIQMQTLVGAFRAGALSRRYWRQWAARAAQDLGAHERRAAPPGWLCAFQRYARDILVTHRHFAATLVFSLTHIVQLNAIAIFGA